MFAKAPLKNPFSTAVRATHSVRWQVNIWLRDWKGHLYKDTRGDTWRLARLTEKKWPSVGRWRTSKGVIFVVSFSRCVFTGDECKATTEQPVPKPVSAFLSLLKEMIITSDLIRPFQILCSRWLRWSPWILERYIIGEREEVVCVCVCRVGWVVGGKRVRWKEPLVGVAHGSDGGATLAVHSQA